MRIIIDQSISTFTPTFAGPTTATHNGRFRRHTGGMAPNQVHENKRVPDGLGSSNERAPKRQVIQAMLKGQVVLVCNLQPAETDDAVSLVLWYKDKSMVPIYR